MKIFISIILVLVFLSSCSKYQCITISSDNTSHNNKNEFVVENDTLKIAYSFYTTNGAVQISIFNKSTRGIQVDWSKSSVIVGENTLAFFHPSVRRHSKKDKINTSNNVIFIPPGATVSQSSISFTGQKFIADDNFRFEKEKIRVSRFTKKITRARIEKANSPLQFRIYLAFLPGTEDGSTAFVVDRSFYVSEIIHTKATATEIFPRSLNSNMIIMRKSTGIKPILIATASTAVIVTSAIIIKK